MSDTHQPQALTVVERGAIERAADARAMSPVVAAGLEILRASPNPTPEMLRELLAVNREWEENEARKAFEAALVALKRDLPTKIAHDKTVDFTNKAGIRTHYTHTSLAAAMDAVTGPLAEHGFSLTWNPKTERGEVSVTCRLAHRQGHFRETTISAPIDTQGGKSAIQGVASTITMLQRYTALSLLGIATADMEEPKPAEPPRPDPSKVDSNRNLRAVGRLVQLGKTREQAEAFLGRKVAEWTAADVERLGEWMKAKPDTKKPPVGEPGGDEPTISDDEDGR
jgi:hypothetical protein